MFIAFVKSGLIELYCANRQHEKQRVFDFYAHATRNWLATITAAAVCTILRSNKCQLTLRDRFDATMGSFSLCCGCRPKIKSGSVEDFDGVNIDDFISIEV